ncbi:hypothetical protein F0L74_02145 [Chitinophaga agrisoli]|uniref:Uncharacterized protein n=1 Tax=Chitinophaga agrisoli TaxID=2607653 RepID=A0A5B2W3F2_9BACT|nr:hypothetical protein [Chitinophaga agrisoli]KAA2244799.1 hypothetical protein F0L74_02145 [Chitinophaga agrisoli]
MKRLFILAVLLSASIAFQPSNAQVRLNVNVNIGSQPAWGPTGYDYAENYYLPDIDAYYNIPSKQFIYLDGPRWVRTATLPARYRGFDLYHSYKVVINEPRPYLHHDVYRTRYAGYRGRYDQVVIRDSHSNRAFADRDHHDHNTWRNDRSRGRGHKH